MASEALVEELEKLIQAILKLDSEELAACCSWMKGTYDEAGTYEADAYIGRNFSILEHLNKFPLNDLAEYSANEIKNEIKNMKKILNEVNGYVIKQTDPTGIGDRLIVELRQNSDKFYEVTARWVLFLAFQKGDTDTN